MKTVLLAFLVGFGSFLAFATNMVTVAGKLTNITDKAYVIETVDMVYSIDKMALDPIWRQKLDRTEVEVKLSVPMEAIQSVKPKKQKK